MQVLFGKISCQPGSKAVTCWLCCVITSFSIWANESRAR